MKLIKLLGGILPRCYSHTDAEISFSCRHLADELTRLRRLMQTAGRSASEEDQDRKPPP